MEKVISEAFDKFLSDIESGKEIINEGEIPTAKICQMVREAMYSTTNTYAVPSNGSKPSMDYVASILGVKYEENPMDNKEFSPLYEKVCTAYDKAKLAYVEVLNRELKKIK